MTQYLFTSESVSEGHPDKLADQISDTILGKILGEDPDARVAVETFLVNGLVVIGGEVTTSSYVDVTQLARQTILDVGYDHHSIGLDGASCGVTLALNEQSPEIAGGVSNALEGRTASGEVDVRTEVEKLGAGDQGIIFGYAVNDNEDFFPVAGKIAHLLTAKHADLRKNGAGKNILLPDAKSQVTIAYENGIPVGVHSILISTQHTKKYNLKTIQSFVQQELIEPVLNDYINNHHYGVELFNTKNYLINPAGEWNLGGPAADTGLTGRKIIVDSYTGYARHGGGAYSGKDPSKVDRSAAYALRWVAKNLVAAGLAEELEIQVAYAIGSSQPVSISVDTKGRKSVGKNVLEGIIMELFDLRPGAIIETLQLKTLPTGTYNETAKNGHFGRNPKNSFTWEKLDKVETIQQFLS